MAKLVYAAIASLDGYVADEQGKWDWSIPSDEVHVYVNDLEREIGIHLLGRRMYEVLSVWEDPAMLADDDPATRVFAELWLATDKVVYSRTLETVSTARTTLEREFDPDAVLELKAAAERDLSVGGPELAGQALAAGLVDEVCLLLSPVIVGGGNPALPSGLRVDLELADERRFDNGVVGLRYLVGSERPSRGVTGAP
jgi:dihydrofolate reductase